jgi:hypothetical protein
MLFQQRNGQQGYKKKAVLMNSTANGQYTTTSAAFIQRKQIVFPDPVGVGLQKLIPRRACPNADPSRRAAFSGVKAVGLLFD